MKEHWEIRDRATAPWVCFCHHKCASQYVRGCFQTAARWLGLAFQAVGVVELSHEGVDGTCSRKALRVNGSDTEELTADILYFGNANTDVVELLSVRGGYRGFHVIRDPRDILISGYFSHRYSHKMVEAWGTRMAEHRQCLEAQPSAEDGLLQELDFSSKNFTNIANWNYDDPNIFETRFEVLTADPWTVYLAAFQFLGLNTPRWGLPTSVSMAAAAAMFKFFRLRIRQRDCFPQPVLRHILARHAFERRTNGRIRGQEDVRHHYRKGVAGDWRSYFTPRVTNEFKARYGDLLIHLGYESSKDW